MKKQIYSSQYDDGNKRRDLFAVSVIAFVVIVIVAVACSVAHFFI